jgi:hypothetical protein
MERRYLHVLFRNGVPRSGAALTLHFNVSGVTSTSRKATNFMGL